jgi:hypothetical protein
MTRYWYEKRMLGLSPTLLPTSWQGWLFQPAVVWVLIAASGSWLISYAPEGWRNGLGLAVLTSALVLSIVVLFLKTDPGPGWWAGWEKERRLVPRFRRFSLILYLAGAAVGFWVLATRQHPAFGILFLWAYQLPAIALLYKTAGSAKNGGCASTNSVAGLSPPKFES